MTVKEIVDLVEGNIVTGVEFIDLGVDVSFASDLMSDVLTIKSVDEIMLLTGLANTQTIRTCEMSDIRVILFVRGKKVTEEMKELAEENEMILIESKFSMYKAAGILYNQKLSPVY